MGGNFSVGEILNKGRIPATVDVALEHRNVDRNAFRKDLYLNLKYLNLYDYITSAYGKYDPEFSDYLYENYYLKNIKKDIHVSDVALEKCKEINNKYGTKIFLSADSADCEASLNAVQNEFEAWNGAGRFCVKYPRTIDFSLAKQNWYDSDATYGVGRAAATTNNLCETISFAKMSKEAVKRSIRHEMTHLNDNNAGATYNLSNIKDSSPLREMFEQQLFKEELVNAGIPESHVSYAYNNTAEFIAVASEGDFSKYSEEFKKLLIALGMPVWEINLK